MRDLLYVTGELIIVILMFPLILIGAILLGLLYFIYVIYEFIKMIIFNK